MAKRERKVVVSGVTREQADAAFAVYAKAAAQSAKIAAEIELQCAKIREKYATRLSELEAEKDAAFDELQCFAMENQAELFSKRKSLEMAHGVIGFRTGTPKLKTLKGFTWASALELVKTFMPGYVRQTEELAKDKILADRDVLVAECGGLMNGIDPLECQTMREAMSRCGMQVVQDEAFFVEPKKED